MKTKNLPRSQHYVLRKSVRKLSLSSSLSTSDVETEDTSSSSQGALNIIIPPPNDFEGLNHPFRWKEKYLSGQSQSSVASNQTQSRNVSESQKSKKTKRLPSSPNRNKKSSLLSQLLGNYDFDCDGEGCVSQIVVSESTNCTVFSHQSTLSDLNSSVNSYFGAANRIANGEKFKVLAKRTAAGGEIQYLIEWEGNNS